MKKKLCILLALLLLALSGLGANAEWIGFTEDNPKVTFYRHSTWWTVGERWGEAPAEPYVDEDGNYYVPLETLRDTFGLSVYENKEHHTVTVRSRDHMIYQGIDCICVYVDNVAKNALAPFYNEGGILMVPVEQYLSDLGYWTLRTKSDLYPRGFLEITCPDQTLRLSSLEVNKTMQMVTVFAKDYAGREHPVRYMICSTGTPGKSETPVGTYKIRSLSYFKDTSNPWYFFKTSDCWIQYCTQIYGDICFHSVPYDEYAYSSLSRSGYNALGRKASHGCVRLFAEDAKFVWENCSGLTVRIIEGSYDATLQAEKDKILAEKLPYNTYKQNLINYGVQ